jgi:uncharacterized membrane protein
MEFLAFLLLIIILLVLISLRTKILDQDKRLVQMTDVLERIRAAQSKAGVIPGAGVVQEKPVEKPSEILSPKPPEVTREHRAPVPKPVNVPEKEPEPPLVSGPTVRPPQPQPAPVEAPRKTFFERNPDLEKFIGENLVNKIGIGILILGIGFFVKFAIDEEWIGIYGRVFIGILCGGILIGLAHRLRKSFAAFSSVLVGGGIAVLYLTIALAFQEYKIMSKEAAFVIMVMITGFTVALSLAYDRIELAILGILGGFASPFMVSTGEGNYIVLFGYILILDTGMLVLAYYKKWNPVNILAYAATLLLFVSWISFSFDDDDPSMIRGAFIFATLFYLVFFAMNIVNNLRQRTSFKGVEFGLLLSNTFFYYGAGIVLLSNPHADMFKGLFTALLGVFNFVFAFLLYRNARVDKNLVFLLIGLVLTFISLAAPVQLEGNNITLFWAAETVLLLWLSQKSGIRLMKIASVLVMILMGISLVMDWYNVYYYNDLYTPDYALNVIINKGYITSIVSIISIAMVIRLLRNESDNYEKLARIYRNVLMFAGGVFLYVSHLLELSYQLNVTLADYSARSVIIGSYNMLFMLVFLLVEPRFRFGQPIRNMVPAVGVFAIFSYLLVYHGEIITTRNFYLDGTFSSLGFLFHYVLIALLLAVAAFSMRKFQTLTKFNEQTHNLYSWFFVFFFIFIASAELDHTVLLSAGTSGSDIYWILTQNHKIGYPILWGIGSFILITIGLRKKLKHLRVISLSLMLITLMKLFLFDLRGISEGGKIAAFISLGVLLLVVSFMYQRLKKLLL